MCRNPFLNLWSFISSRLERPGWASVEIGMPGKLAAILQTPSLVGAQPIRAQPGEDFQILHSARIEPDHCVVAYGRCASHRPTAGGCRQRQSLLHPEERSLLRQARYWRSDIATWAPSRKRHRPARHRSRQSGRVGSHATRRAFDRHSSLTGRVSEVMIEGRVLRRKGGS